ncbi:hypothetical protein QR685DRAFT_210689 [Neurospora intermedia]|uniref:Uncharacterized protein n=1 Tax=Neurospora intermedia TaxID=5142 RepID=A0ABR3DG56_NEUIN
MIRCSSSSISSLHLKLSTDSPGVNASYIKPLHNLEYCTTYELAFPTTVKPTTTAYSYPSSLSNAMDHGWNHISLFVFSLILTNAASVHSTNTRRQLAAALQSNTVLVEHHDQGQLAPALPFLEPCPATTAPTPVTTATTATATETTQIGAVYLPSPPSPSPPEASCMMAIWSLIVDIPTPGPTLSAALHQAKDTLVPSAVASPQCTITLPTTLSSEYGVYTSRVSSWVSKHSEELDTLDSVCAETSRDTGMGTGPGCTAPVAVFTGETSVGATSTGATFTGTGSTGAISTGTISIGTGTTAGGGSGGGSSTAKATESSTGVMTSSTTTATVTSSVTSSLTGSATTVAVVTSSQSLPEPQAGGAARVTGILAVPMVVAGFLGVVVAL